MANHLAQESSPYLLQHAENPVDWYPWSDAAFAKAKAENKPIFLSIGYSTCHWCHVMEGDSFEKEDVAELLNRDYVSIKVDREERPDVDGFYMKAVQAMNQRGGWPLSDNSSYEEDLTKDVLEIITVFSARLYGSRSHRNRNILKSLKAAADEACK